jgi:hypothetical protein
VKTRKICWKLEFLSEKTEFSFWIFPCLKCLVNIIIVCVFIIIIIVKNYDEDSIYCSSSSSGVTVLVVFFFLIIIFFIFTKNFLVKNTVLIWSFFFQSVGHWTLLFKFLMYVCSKLRLLSSSSVVFLYSNSCREKG